MVAVSGFYSFARRPASFSRQGCFAASGKANLFSQFPRRSRLLSGVLHSLGPINTSFPVSDLSKQVSGDKVDVMHLVAVRTQNRKILNVIVLSVAVEMGNFENLRNSEATIRTDGRVVIEGNLSVVDASHGVSPSKSYLRQARV